MRPRARRTVRGDAVTGVSEHDRDERAETRSGARACPTTKPARSSDRAGPRGTTRSAPSAGAMPRPPAPRRNGDQLWPATASPRHTAEQRTVVPASSGPTAPLATSAMPATASGPNPATPEQLRARDGAASRRHGGRPPPVRAGRDVRERDRAREKGRDGDPDRRREAHHHRHSVAAAHGCGSLPASACRACPPDHAPSRPPTARCGSTRRGPTSGADRGAIVVIQEAFGVNAHIEDVTRRFADAGLPRGRARPVPPRRAAARSPTTATSTR